MILRRLLGASRRKPSFLSVHTTTTTAAAAATTCLLLSATRNTVESFSTVSNNNNMPNPPYQYKMSETKPFDLSDLGKQICEHEEIRQRAYDLSRKLQVTFSKDQALLEEDPTNGSTSASEALLNTQTDFLPASSNRNPRLANLSNRMEDFSRLLAYRHFLLTGTLLPLSDLPMVTDEEYLAGACMGLCQDLSRYGLGRATTRDVDSVRQAAELVEAILDFLLQLDLRNGPLRRKYDGTKYALKSLETLLYELAVTGAGGETATEPQTKKVKRDLLPQEQLQELKQRMEHRDNLRETLIKKCRDGQKAAKQSIFALHRGDKTKAEQLLQQCHDGITSQLLPIVQEEQPLRGGSFANVLEEYVEAKLFMAWLHGKEEEEEEEDKDSSRSGVLLRIEDFAEAGISLEPEEYIGGLCDLTGELGREAVKRGTSRDVNGVKLCLQANSNILTALQTMERLPGGTGKKMDAVRRSVEKLHRMLYELSLSEAAGGRHIETSIKEERMEE